LGAADAEVQVATQMAIKMGLGSEDEDGNVDGGDEGMQSICE
jgi:hypothetical protein